MVTLRNEAQPVMTTYLPLPSIVGSTHLRVMSVVATDAGHVVIISAGENEDEDEREVKGRKAASAMRTMKLELHAD